MRHLLLLAILCTAWADARAKPSGPQLFCSSYPTSPLCAGTMAGCNTCHNSTSPDKVDWNAFGYSILAEYTAPFETGLPAALSAIESADSDGDGLTNAVEIDLGSLPGDATSKPANPNPPHGSPNPRYDVGGYDYRQALRRVGIVYCGRSPTYDEMVLLAASDDPGAVLHLKLDACLQSDYWRNERLARLVDPAVRPIDFGSAWKWDYRLFRYLASDGRDMRELLSADYYVRELTPGVLTPIYGPFAANTGVACEGDGAGVCDADQVCTDKGSCNYADGGQTLQTNRRAGMITTSWFHLYNTMFSKLPRQTAAQAYRAWLGMDIARLQGILPVGDEPLDIDGKGVAQAECAQCHSTLDPLAYEFAYYNGIGGTGGAATYDPNRPTTLGLWTPETRPQGVFMGQPIESVLDWAALAAGSEQFQRTVTLLFYEHAIGHPPRPEDLAEFTELWQSLPADAYSADKLNHRLIDTDAFGVL